MLPRSARTRCSPMIRAMVATLPDTLLGRRDRCLLLLGFASAMRRSELVALDVRDVVDTNDGLVVTVTRSKTDQEGEGRQIGVPYGANPTTCPVRAFRSWIEICEITGGPLFRPINRHGQLGEERLSDQAVALVVKRTAQAAGLDPKLVAGHSLRRYIRRGSLFSDNAAAKLGL